MRGMEKYGLIVLICLIATGLAQGAVKTDNRPYLCEIGVQAGCGYYVGDATTHIFQNVREAYGAHFRYKFDQRWAIQVKGLAHTIKGPYPPEVPTDAKWTVPMVNVDVMGEFNFLRLGLKQYDKRVKTYSPYIFAGIGVSLFGQKFQSVACYIPVGIGFKWKFAPHWGLNIAWQHNIYMSDEIECMAGLGNTWNMNGSNWLNCDVTGQLTLGIVFDFARHKKVCRHCGQ